MLTLTVFFSLLSCQEERPLVDERTLKLIKRLRRLEDIKAWEWVVWGTLSPDRGDPISLISLLWMTLLHLLSLGLDIPHHLAKEKPEMTREQQDKVLKSLEWRSVSSLEETSSSSLAWIKQKASVHLQLTWTVIYLGLAEKTSSDLSPPRRRRYIMHSPSLEPPPQTCKEQRNYRIS